MKGITLPSPLPSVPYNTTYLWAESTFCVASNGPRKNSQLTVL